MSRRREASPRAAVRRRYLQLASRAGAPAPVAVPAPPGTGEMPPAGAQPLAQVRSLYEDTVVPVRRIAELAGVGERMIYKYAARGNWKPRVVRLARGAGGRFVPLAEADRPVPAGLHALDPAGAARAAGRCLRAGQIARDAAAEIVRETERRSADDKLHRLLRALARLHRALALLRVSACAGTRRRRRNVRGFGSATIPFHRIVR